MPVSGSAGSLTAILQKVGSAASGELTKVVLKSIAAEALTQAQLGFRESRDPYDSPWAPIKYRKGMPLRDTGRLANSITARATAEGFVIGTNVRYAQYHQQGTRGHKAHSRTQYANKKGRFISAKRVDRMLDKDAKRREEAEDAGRKVRSGRLNFTRRKLNFREGGGAIPKRAFLPDERGLGPIWEAAIQASAVEAFKKFWVP